MTDASPIPVTTPKQPPPFDPEVIIADVRDLMRHGDHAALLALVRRLRIPRGADPDGLVRIGRALCDGGELGLAAEWLGSGSMRVAADQGRTDVLAELARVWVAMGEGVVAAETVAKALGIDPTHPGALAVKAAIDAGEGALPTPAGIRALFDAMAPLFDAHLQDRLKYTAPSFLADLLSRHGVVAGADLAVLDVGCGTGLLGRRLRDRARSLDGVDLSPAMLAEARAAGGYDRLDCGELVALAAERPGRYDLVAAADVLIYLRDLHPVFIALAGALRPGGLFMGTVESGQGDTPTRGDGMRWMHGPGHVDSAARGAGLTQLAMEPLVLRQEGCQPVPGLAFLYRRDR